MVREQDCGGEGRMPEIPDLYVDFPADDGGDAPTDGAQVIEDGQLRDWLSLIVRAIAQADGVEIALNARDPAVQSLIEEVLESGAAEPVAFASQGTARIILNIGGCHPKGPGPTVHTLGEFGPPDVGPVNQ